MALGKKPGLWFKREETYGTQPTPSDDVQPLLPIWCQALPLEELADAEIVFKTPRAQAALELARSALQKISSRKI